MEILNSIRKEIISEEDIEIYHQKAPHKSSNLPNGKMAVYCFVYKNKFLKIGKVNTNSKARFSYQHYNPNSSNSNLAKSLLNDNSIIQEFNENNIGNWIKENTDRIDIIINKSLGIFVLNFIESFLHLKFTPKYEGFKIKN